MFEIYYITSAVGTNFINNGSNQEIKFLILLYGSVKTPHHHHCHHTLSMHTPFTANFDQISPDITESLYF